MSCIMFNLLISIFSHISFKKFITKFDDVMNIFRNQEISRKYVKLNLIHTFMILKEVVFTLHADINIKQSWQIISSHFSALSVDLNYIYLGISHLNDIL